jgi:DNA polymerase-3 subunit alpha
MSFVHLHNHSSYSLLKAMLTFDEMCKQAAEWAMPAVAMTDYGNLHGAYEFFQTAKKHGVKPIVGLDITLVDGDARERTKKYPSYALVLLAENNEGLRNLYQICSKAQTEGFYYKPRIDWTDLKAHGRGLIALTGNRFGIPGTFLQDDRPDVAQAKLNELIEVLGPNQVYLEVMDTGLPIQKKINEGIRTLSKQMGLPMVAANDTHYLVQEDAKAHDVLLCVGSGKFLHEENRQKFPTDQYYFRSPDEMASLFFEFDQACENTLAIAQRCNIEMDRKGYFMPQYETKPGQTLDDALTEMSVQGMHKRLAQRFALENIPADQQPAMEKMYRARLDEELGIIISMGFSGYFLIVQDFINYAKNNGIPVGPGRGSAAGSLVAYATQITDVDPIPYNLLFERFLNPERISMPDIDVDFCQYRRDEVLKYVSEKYDEPGITGARMAQICTFGKLQPRAAIRDVGRVMGVPYGDVDKLAKLVPSVLNISMSEAFEMEPKFAQLRQEDAQTDELLTIAKRVEGLHRHASVHAAGVVISDADPLLSHLPLMTGQKDEMVTQWDMKAVEKIGLVKFDFLGLKTLTLLQKAVSFIKESCGDDVDLLSIPMHDTKVFELLSRGETQGIFQLESSGMRDLVIRLKPSGFEDIVALVALYRPGPLGSGMVDDFINRKHGRTQIQYDLPELEEILKETYGVILYQEQVMQIASKLASYTLGDADLLRRAMGKKIKEEMDQQQEKFLAGAAKNGHPKNKAEKIFDLMAKFAGYGFNKSHSAAYALISYQTAYLKAHYPVEFMAACFSLDRNNTDRVVSHLADCRASNIDVLPPDVNQSALDFMVRDGKIRFGLAGIKNVGETAIESMIEARHKQGPFTSLFNLCERVTLRQVNKKVLESLIKSGALDDLAPKRAQLMMDVEKAIEYGSKTQKDKRVGQDSLFGSSLPAPSSDAKNIPEWDEGTRLQFEKESVGFYITGHPLLKSQHHLTLYTNAHTANLLEKPHQSSVRLGGLISTKKEITTKKGARMAFITMDDLHGSVEVVVFPNCFELAQEVLTQDQPIFVVGKLDIQDEQAKVLADHICLLDHADQYFDGKVHIQLDASQMQADGLQQLKDLIDRHQGSCPIVLHMEIPGKSKTILPLSQAFKLKPTVDVFEAIQNQLGPQTKIFLQ